MIDDNVFKLMKCFSFSFINQSGEFIAHREANEYFKLSNCKNELEVKCKVLEWLSRGASKTEPFRTKKKNEQFNRFMLNGINDFLGTDFTANEMSLIYQELGNGVDKELTVKFIESGFDMDLLKGEV